MSCLLFSILLSAGSFIVAWVFLPEPQFVRDFWARMGWARRT